MIAEALHEYAKSLERQWEHDRANTIGASEIGKCARQVYYQKNLGDPVYGVPTDPGYQDDWGYKLRGQMMEEHFWVPAMKAMYGDSILFAGANQKTLVDGFLSSTADGLLRLNPLECEVQVAKSIDPRVQTLPKPEHVYQVKVQIGMFWAQTKWSPKQGRLSYIDASCWSVVKEFVIERDPALYETAKERAKQIMTARSPLELKPEGWIAGGRECEQCPFTKACGRERQPKERDAGKKLDPAFVRQIETKAWLHRAVKKQEEDAANMKRKIEEEIKEMLRREHVSKIPGIVSWTAQNGRKKLDLDAIENDGINLAPYWIEGTPGDRFAITLRGEETSK